MMMVMVGWLVIATALFMLRPSRLRGNGDQKPAGGGGGDNVSQGSGYGKKLRKTAGL